MASQGADKTHGKPQSNMGQANGHGKIEHRDNTFPAVNEQRLHSQHRVTEISKKFSIQDAEYNGIQGTDFQNTDRVLE